MRIGRIHSARVTFFKVLNHDKTCSLQKVDEKKHFSIKNMFFCKFFQGWFCRYHFWHEMKTWTNFHCAKSRETRGDFFFVGFIEDFYFSPVIGYKTLTKHVCTTKNNKHQTVDKTRDKDVIKDYCILIGFWSSRINSL